MNRRHSISGLVVALSIAILSGVSGVHAQNPALKSAAECAPRAATGEPWNGFRVIGGQDSAARSLFGDRDLLIIGGGTGDGLQLGQQYTIRRVATAASRRVVGSGPHVVNTVGRLRIVAANQTTAFAAVELACDGIVLGDYLEPYTELVLPPGADRADTTGELDFSAPGRILFGEDGHVAAGPGAFMIADVGSERGASVGARYAVFRDLHLPGLPIAPVGEAVVVFANTGTSVVRVTLARDAVQSGDLLIPRK